MTEDARKHVLAFLEQHPLGVVATIGPEGGPRARSVYFVADEALNIHFLTLSSTRKFIDLERNGNAAFVVSAESPAQTVQLEGEVTDLTEEAQVDDPAVQKLSRHMEAHGILDAPLAHLDPGVLTYYRLTPTFIRLGDFTNGYGSKAVFTEVAC